VSSPEKRSRILFTLTSQPKKVKMPKKTGAAFADKLLTSFHIVAEITKNVFLESKIELKFFYPLQFKLKVKLQKEKIRP